MADYFPGQSVDLSVSFYVGDTLTDPTTVSLKVMDPAGTTTEYTLAGGTIDDDGVGLFSKNVTLSTEGTWRWRWAGTGSVVAATEGHIDVKRSVFV